MKIFIIRHAQSLGNKEGYLQGQEDSPVTSQGYRQTYVAAQHLSSIRLKGIFTSPIQRALTTANIIQSKQENCFVEKVPDLMEINVAPWVHKKTTDLINDKSIHGYYTYKHNPKSFIPLDGEGFGEVQLRMVRAFQNIIQQSIADNEIAIVSHSVAIRTLLIWIENMTLEHIWSYDIAPSSITTVIYENGKYTLQNVGFDCSKN